MLMRELPRNVTGRDAQATAYLHAAVVAHRALEGLLMRVFVATVAHQLAAGYERHVAVRALVWPGA